MARNGFGTAHYLMGSDRHGHHRQKTDNLYPAPARRWQGLVFANDPMACIGMDGKSGVTKGGDISNPFKTIQDRNVMVTMKWGTGDRQGHGYAPVDLSQQRAGCRGGRGRMDIRSIGGAYAAIRIVEGGYKWSRPWQHSATFSVKEKSYVTPASADTPIITVASDAGADYGNDFAALRALIAQPIGWKKAAYSPSRSFTKAR